MIFEHEVRRIRIYCETVDCMNTGGGKKSTHRNVKDFSEKTKKAVIKAFEAGTRINATTAFPTQGRWKKTKNGWYCPKCKRGK